MEYDVKSLLMALFFTIVSISVFTLSGCEEYADDPDLSQLLLLSGNDQGFACYGTAAGDPGVCSGNGSCTAEDTCDCDPGWVGSECAAAAEE
jgi:hypothetical protein